MSSRKSHFGKMSKGVKFGIVGVVIVLAVIGFIIYFMNKKGSGSTSQQDAAKKAQEVADIAAKKAQEAADIASKKAQEAADIAAKKAQEAADIAAKKAQDAADIAAKKAQEYKYGKEDINGYIYTSPKPYGPWTEINTDVKVTRISRTPTGYLAIGVADNNVYQLNNKDISHTSRDCFTNSTGCGFFY